MQVMKKLLVIIVFGFLFSLSLNAKDFYYYYGYANEKIFLQQRTNKIYLKLESNTTKEKMLSVIGNNNVVEQLMFDTNLYKDLVLCDAVVLESKERQQISSKTIDYFNANSDVVSVTYLLQYNETLIGLTDEFVIKLKETTTFAQLQKLVEQNNCKIKEENIFAKNQFMLSVPKESKISALEMSISFYETGLFDFSEPNFIILNAFNTNDIYWTDQWG
jgi:hypothetical protein